MSRVHTIGRLEKPDGWATHKTGCGIPLVSNGADSFARAPISSGDLILTTALGLEPSCGRCLKSRRLTPKPKR